MMKHPTTVHEIRNDKAIATVAEALWFARAAVGEGSADEMMTGMDWHVAVIAVRALREAHLL